MTATVAGIHLSGNHAGRPAANTVPDGSLYSCTTHSLIYQSNFAGNSWSTWATLGGTGLSDPMTTRGDIIVRNSSNVTARLAAGSADTVLKSDGTDVAYGKVLPANLDVSADNTTANATSGHHGLLPKLSGSSSDALKGDGTWGAVSGGGTTYGAAVAYPTSFSGDDDDGSSFTPWVDQTAFDVATVINSTILNVVTKGASKDQFKRKTLGTTKAAAFDFRWWGCTPDLTYWSGAEDAYVELRLLTSGGTQVAGWRIKPQALAAGQVQFRVGVYGGGGIVTTNVDPTIIRGQAVLLRVVRDGSDKLTYYMGMGVHGGLVRWIQQSDDAPYNPTQSGTIARAEVAIHTPSGPGGTAEFGFSWDAFQSA